MCVRCAHMMCLWCVWYTYLWSWSLILVHACMMHVSKVIDPDTCVYHAGMYDEFWSSILGPYACVMHECIMYISMILMHACIYDAANFVLDELTNAPTNKAILGVGSVCRNPLLENLQSFNPSWTFEILLHLSSRQTVTLYWTISHIYVLLHLFHSEGSVEYHITCWCLSLGCSSKIFISSLPRLAKLQEQSSGWWVCS